MTTLPTIEAPADVPPAAPATAGAAEDRRRLPIAWYPTVLAVALVVELINVGGTSPFAATRPMILAIVGGILLAALGRLVLGDRDRGGVLAALWVLAFLGSEDIRLTFAIIAATVLLLLERYGLPPARQTIRWSRIDRIAGRIVIVLCLAIVIQAVQLGSLSAAVRAATHETAFRPTTDAAPATSAAPDIYMILLDGHTRSDVFASTFGGDETVWRSALESRGFDVLGRSRSNYTQTAETLASMLNAAQLSDIDALDGLLAQTEGRPPGAVIRRLLDDSRAWGFLRARGYQIDTVSSGFEQVAMREGDRFVDTGQLNEFEVAVLKRSLAGHLLSWLAPDAVSAQQRDRIHGDFDAFASAPDWIGAGPQFVFAHVPSPHPPWVFGPDGTPRTVDFHEEWLAETPASTGLTDAELRAGYKAQVDDVDRWTLEALDRLDAGIAARGRPAITIVFSDHGSWIGADGGDIRQRFKNLLAIRSTGAAASIVLADNETLVNLFPDLFDQVFGAGWARQPDTEYRFGTKSAFELYPVDDPDAAASP